MADQTNIIPINPNTFSSEVYSPKDESLIGSSIEQNQFDTNTDYVEYFIFDLNNNKISPSGNDATFTDFTILDNEIYVNPETDVLNRDIDTGTVNSLYNFYRKWANSSPQSTYYISEISSDRTEIRLDSNLISREEIISSVSQFVSYREVDETFPDFYINLGSNILFIANNIKLDTNNTVLIKLYEPLPANVALKTSLWIVEKISTGLAYQVKFESAQLTPRTFPQLAGPNINLPIKGQLNNSTEEISLSDLSSPNSQSEYQINSYFNDPSISINVDYSDYSNFVNYSSAKNRIENFWYKVSLIESASEQITIQNTLTNNPATSASIAPLNNLINETITNFDSYEYYLYFESSSDTYPKVSSTPPYQNESTGSVVAQEWYVAKLSSSEDYDRENQNWLQYAAPQFIQDDPTNNQYLTFLNMIGHFVDNDIWVYLKDTTNKWDADNRINAGVSKDLVAQVLRDMGVKLYQNNFSSTDLYSAFLGFTDSGSLFPFPYMTGSVESAPGILDTPDGYEYITNFISSSNEAIPLDDINKRIYKRIYHNLPYLLKSKGTVEGLRTLITSYGIPDTILRISEFGGKDKINVNDWDLWKHQYNYQYNTLTGGYITSSWNQNTGWSNPSPQTLQFRFKLPKSGSNAVDNAENLPQQVLWSLDTSPQIAIGLDYYGDGFTSGSWSGSVPSESFEYANLAFTTDGFATTSSVYLPFFDGEWWSVMLTKEVDTFTLYAGNKIYNGNDGSQIGFFESTSSTILSTDWDRANNSFFPTDRRAAINAYEAFSGSYQEIRYFDQAISESVFKDYVMNPQSSEGNGVNGSANQLSFRASLGGELYTGSVSVHPKVSYQTPLPSFTGNTSNFSIENPEDETFTSNREWVFYDSPPVGIKNRNTDKIKRQDLVLPAGDTLSNQRSIQQKSYTTQDYTNNLNLLEVAFSPQNQINDDIIGQIGYFNVGDYIGDPRLVSSSTDTYPSLVELSKQYFEKYTSSYNVYDYIRLIKFFDNSLFKMIKDFVPSRTGLASGIVVKQHILERQKYPTPQAAWTRPEYTGSIGSTPALLDGARYYEASTDYESNPIVTVEGGAGGSVNEFNRPTGYLNLTGGLNANPKPLEQTLFSLDAFTGAASVNFGDAYPETAVTPSINDDGEFVNTNNITFKGEVMIGWINSIQTNQTVTFRLYEDGEIVNTVSQYVDSPYGVATQWYVTMPNVEFKPNRTYKFTVIGSALMNAGSYTAKFYQLDPPLDYRSGQFYEVTNITPLGNVNEVIRDNHELYDGEFSGSVITVTNGELNTECDEFKEASTTEITYNLSGSFELTTWYFLNKLGGADYQFNGSTSSGLGKIYANWQLDRTEGATRGLSQGTNYYFKIVGFGIKIPNSLNGVNVRDYITSAKEFKILDANFTPSNFTTTGWTVAGKQVTGQTNGDITLYPISIQKRQAYPNVAIGGEYFYIETEPSDLTFKFFVDIFDSPGDVDDITVAAKGALSTIFEPFVPETFQNSDCNPLINNATDITPSTVYYDVDYANNPNVAVNFDTIMSGSAPKAKIQDYNYHARRSIIPRYSGSRNTSNTYNVEDGAINATQALFGYFNWVGGTSPEWGNGLEDRSVANLRFLLDVNGKIIKPINDSQGINQGIVENNFTEGKIATLAFDDETGSSAAFSNLLGNHTIFKSGKDITPICYSQTESIASGSSGGYTTTLTFVQGDQQGTAAKDYRFTANNGGGQIVNTGAIDFAAVSLQDATYVDWTGNITYSPTAGNSPSTDSISLTFIGAIKRSAGPVNKVVTVQFFKNGSAVGTAKQFDFSNTTYNSLDITYTDATATASDDYELRVTSLSGTGTLTMSTDSYFKVTQNPAPNIGNATAPFWEVGGSNNIVRTTTGFLPYYGQKQQDITGSGFFGIVNNFRVQVGDEIRFQGTETQAYKVTRVHTGGSGKINLTLDRDVTATNLQWFLVRRYVDNPANIILEVDKPAGGTSPGILKPQYLSKDAEDNIDTILENLRRDSLI